MWLFSSATVILAAFASTSVRLDSWTVIGGGGLSCVRTASFDDMELVSEFPWEIGWNDMGEG